MRCLPRLSLTICLTAGWNTFSLGGECAKSTTTKGDLPEEDVWRSQHPVLANTFLQPAHQGHGLSGGEPGEKEPRGLVSDARSLVSNVRGLVSEDRSLVLVVRSLV